MENYIKTKSLKYILLLIVISFTLISCGESDPVMQDIKKQGKLIVLTRNSPTTYFLDSNDSPAGFEYDLTKALADSLRVEVEYKLYDSIEDIIQAINNGEGHIAAAGLTQTELREKSNQFGPKYKTVQQQVVCHRTSNLPETPVDLINKSLLIIAESSYQESLLELQQKHPKLKWETTNELSTEQVLEKVANNEVDCTVADSNIITLNRRYYPDLMVAFAISEQQELAWLIPNNSDYFKHYVKDWFEKIEENSVLDIINERYYGYADLFDYYDNQVYLERIKKRLPKYQAAFRKVAEQHQIPWVLLAAQSYQESGWNEEARSPTGVRGLMMLTQNTAKAMGVKKRLDPLQSIKGGAKYLDRLLKKIPDDVVDSDRIWFALAAYNVGYAHLLDARKLAIKQGKNPGIWADIKEVLPLLSQKQHYKNLKYGYARGSEPVKYIDRIRYYQDVLLNTLK